MGSHFDQIEILTLSAFQRFGDVHDAHLGSIGIDEAHFAGANAIVEPRLLEWRCYGVTFLCKWQCLPS